MKKSMFYVLVALMLVWLLAQLVIFAGARPKARHRLPAYPPPAETPAPPPAYPPPEEDYSMVVRLVVDHGSAFEDYLYQEWHRLPGTELSVTVGGVSMTCEIKRFGIAWHGDGTHVTLKAD